MKSSQENGETGSNGLVRMAWATVIAVLFLILVGGIVRSSGAGLGCPDWPKCWGHWWPPSELENVDLPAVLERFQKRNPELTEADLVRLFDPVHIWVEYLNRLLGVVIGLFVIGTVGFAAAAVRRGKAPRVILELAFLSLILVGFNGWLGASVVRTKLEPAMVTAHLACAFYLLAILIYIALMAKGSHFRTGQTLAHLSGILSGAIAVQVIVGSQVRGGVDTVMKAGGVAREDWLSKVGLLDHAHRFFSWIVIMLLVMMAVRVLRGATSRQKRFFVFLAVAILAQFGIGVGLAYGGMPPALQALHVGVPGLIVCSLSLFWFACAREARDEATQPLPSP